MTCVHRVPTKKAARELGICTSFSNHTTGNFSLGLTRRRGRKAARCHAGYRSSKGKAVMTIRQGPNLRPPAVVARFRNN